MKSITATNLNGNPVVNEEEAHTINPHYKKRG